MDTGNISTWILVVILWVVGLAAWVMTYVLVPIKAKKTNTNISGIPGVPFIIFLIAGLLSPYKLLALICFIDFRAIILVVELISAAFSGDLKYNAGKIYVFQMQTLGYTQKGDLVKTKFDDYTDLGKLVKSKFDEYYNECKCNKEYKKAAKKHKFDFNRYCRIVAGLRTSKYMEYPQGDAYSIEKIWGMSGIDSEALKEILPQDVRDLGTAKGGVNGRTN